MESPIKFMYNLLTEFDEMGYEPTTTVPYADVEAKLWKEKMLCALSATELLTTKQQTVINLQKINIETMSNKLQELRNENKELKKRNDELLSMLRK